MIFMFSNNKKAIHSKIIRFFTRSNLSHCATVVGLAGNMPIILSADELTVNLVPLAVYLDKEKYDCALWEVPILNPDFSVEKIVERYHHKNYGWFDLLYFVYVYVCMTFGWVFKRKNPIDMGIFCSELAVYTLIEMGYGDYLEEYPASTVHPAELLEIVRKLPGVKTDA